VQRGKSVQLAMLLFERSAYRIQAHFQSRQMYG
jgi:hypothetical protein